MHARDEEGHWKAIRDRGFGQRFDFSEIGPCSGDKEKALFLDHKAHYSKSLGRESRAVWAEG